MIYHITSLRGWREAQQRGDYRAESLTTEGFIHCSTKAQVLPVSEKYYQGQRGLFVLEIDPDLLSSELKWEPPAEGAPPPGVPEGDSFPHVYGPIDLNAIVKFYDLETGPDGRHHVPGLDNAA
jgi:uncharacterized protein (DUF952 family)